MKLTRLRGRKVCDRVLRQGQLWKGKTMFVRWMPGHPRHPAAEVGSSAVYIGTLASLKLSKSAVARNRMRRRCREAFRILLKELSNSNNHREALGASGGSQRWSDTVEGKDGPWKGNPWFPFHDVVQLLIAPRSSSLKAPFEDIQKDVSNFFSYLRSCLKPNDQVASSGSR